MALEIKDPDARVDYLIDWGEDYLEGAHLVASLWTVAPVVAGGLVVLGHAHDLLCSKVTVEGGTAGSLYQLTNRITRSDGVIDERSIAVRVDAR
jgi:hypothetical protein